MYNKVKDIFVVNGGIYGYYDERVYHISGEGFISLDRNKYTILIKIKTEINNPKFKEILLKIGVTEETIEKILNILKAGENNG